MIWNKWKNVKVILQLPVGMIAWYFTVEDLSKADPVGAYILDSTVPQYAMVLHYSVSVILTWRCHSKTCTRWILKEIQFFYLFRIIEMKLDRINSWVGGTRDCKIRDLSVGLKVVWGKPVKCHIGGRVCKQNLWYKVVWARYLLLIVTKRACGRKEGRKERSRKWLFWQDQRVQGIHYSRGTGWSVDASWPHPDIVWTKNKQTSSLLPISRSLKMKLGKWSSEPVK